MITHIPLDSMPRFNIRTSLQHISLLDTDEVFITIRTSPLHVSLVIDPTSIIYDVQYPEDVLFGLNLSADEVCTVGQVVPQR